MTTSADPDAAGAEPGVTLPVGSYDDLPDVAVRVVLTVPLAAPLPAPFAAVPGAQVTVLPTPEPGRFGVPGRTVRSHRRRSPLRDAVVVGLAAAALVFGSVAALLVVLDVVLG